jgi:hypothetical protein
VKSPCRPAVFLALLTALSACTGAPPETTRVETQIVYVEDRDLDEVYEELSVAVHVEDADGIDDIVALHVVHDDEGLVWTATDGAWSRRTEGGTQLFVMEGLVTPDGEPLPRGRYRIIAVDAAGHEDEATTVLSNPPASPQTLSFPRLSFERNEMTVSGAFPEVLVYGYSEAGQFLGEFRFRPGQQRRFADVPWLRNRDDEVSLFVAGYDAEGGRYVRSGPYRR